MLSRSNIIYDLFENIVLLSSDSSMICIGSTIKNLFIENEIILDSSAKIILNNNNKLDLFVNLFNNVVKCNEVQTFKFIQLSDEFILFPLINDGNTTIILGLKDKIIQITKIGHELKELIKELQCLYSVSKELETAKPLKQTFENCILHLQQGFRFSREVTINIEFGNTVYGNLDWHKEEVCDILTSDLKSTGIKKGEIRVYTTNADGFTNEEKKLVDEIAGKISRYLEKDEKEKNLEKQQKILRAKNDALLKVTSECNKSREKLKTFFKAITDKIVVIDREYNIIMSNKDNIGESSKCFNKLFNLGERCLLCPASITFDSSNDALIEREYDEKNLTLRTYPIFGEDGKVNRVLEVCSDITNEKKMESQLLQSYKLASLGKLVAGVAHEINNPNTFILGNLKILQEAFVDIFPILDDYVKTNPNLKIARLNYNIFKENISILINDMVNGANRTKKIVNDLRNFAKKDEAGLTDDIDLNYIITNNLTLTQKHIKKYAELEFQLADNIPVFKGNTQRIEQVLHNLILNASEAIEPAEGRILIKTSFESKTNQITLIISDNGCGMEDIIRKNIFDPFFTTKRNKGGTGLGLSISYGIIKDHSGTIEVESKVGQGTKFTIQIPIL
jgi:signal transduction histidine kinase